MTLMKSVLEDTLMKQVLKSWLRKRQITFTICEHMQFLCNCDNELIR